MSCLWLQFLLIIPDMYDSSVLPALASDREGKKTGICRVLDAKRSMIPLDHVA